MTTFEGDTQSKGMLVMKGYEEPLQSFAVADVVRKLEAGKAVAALTPYEASLLRNFGFQLENLPDGKYRSPEKLSVVGPYRVVAIADFGKKRAI